MKIIVDFDDTVVEVNNFILTKLNEAMGTDYSLDDMTSYNYYDNFTEEEADYIMEIWNRPDLYDRDGIDWKEYAREGLMQLNNEHEVILATVLTSGHAESKARWIDNHDQYFDDYYICSRKEHLEADLIIDDGAHHLQEANMAGILIDQPYNQHYEASLGRANDWQEVVDLVAQYRGVLEQATQDISTNNHPFVGKVRP